MVLPAGIFLPSKTVSFVRRLATAGTGGYILIDSFRHIVRYSKQLSPEMSSLNNDNSWIVSSLRYCLNLVFICTSGGHDGAITVTGYVHVHTI